MLVPRTIRSLRGVGAMLLLLPLILGFLFVAHGQPIAAQESSGDAAVRIVHGSSDAGPVDIYIDGELAIDAVEFPTATDAAFIPEGEHQVLVVPSGGALEDAVIDQTVDLAAGTAYIAAAIGTVDSIQLSLSEVDLENIADGQTRVRIAHGSPDAGTIDVSVSERETLVSNLEFTNLGPYVDLEADVYDLSVAAAGDDAPALTAEGVALDAGTVYDIFLIGTAADGTLQALIVDTVPSQQQVAGYPVAVRTGDCSAPGDVVQTLNSLTVPEGEAVGQSDLAAAAASSYSLADVSLDDILGANHAIVVSLSEEEVETVIACGEIGGTLTENGNLALGLREVDASGFTGIAYIETATDEATGVYVFLAEALTGDASSMSGTDDTTTEELPEATPEANL